MKIKSGLYTRTLFLFAFFCFIQSNQIKANTFVYCSEGSPSAFNPQIVSDGTSINASAHPIYNRLIDFEYGTTKKVPSLAQSWTVSDDKKTYTFKLRQNVSFHKTKYFSPSRKFNADDVLFSFNRMYDKKSPYFTVGGGTYEYFNGMGMDKLIAKMSKLDDYTVQITLSRPDATFLGNLALPFMSILSKEYSQQLIKEDEKDNIDIYPIGTGPFIFKKYIKDNLIRYKANKEFFGDKPKIKKLVFAITPDPSVRFQKLKAGECHLINGPSPTDLDQMRKHPKIKVVSQPGLNVGYLALNIQKKPLDNPLVRKAIYHALNKKAYLEAIYLGNAIEAVNPRPPSIWSYDKKAKAPAYDINKAKELIKKAGLKENIEIELWALPVSRPYNPNGKKMGEMMKSDLAKIGINAKLVQYDWSTYLKKSSAGEHDMVQIGWTSDNGDPDNFLHTLLGCKAVNGGSNYARWCDKKYDELVMQAKSLNDQSKREKLYLKAQKIFHEQLPWVPLAHAKVYRAMAKNVDGYKISPFGGDIFTFVSLK